MARAPAPARVNVGIVMFYLVAGVIDCGIRGSVYNDETVLVTEAVADGEDSLEPICHPDGLHD